MQRQVYLNSSKFAIKYMIKIGFFRFFHTVFAFSVFTRNPGVIVKKCILEKQSQLSQLCCPSMLLNFIECQNFKPEILNYFITSPQSQNKDTQKVDSSTEQKINQKVHLAKIMSEIFHAQARASKCNHDAIKREQRHQLPSLGNKDCCFNRF